MIYSTKKGNVTVVTLAETNYFDARTAFRVKAELKELINESERNIALNLKGIEFIDSAGFGAIISGLKSSKRFGGNLKICNASSTVLELIELMHLESVFEIFQNEAKCVESFNSLNVQY